MQFCKLIGLFVQDDTLKTGQKIIDALPHSKLLGMEIVHFGEGNVEIQMPYRSDLIGDPDTKVIHGGAVSALMDTCAGMSVMSHPDGSLATATLGLRIDYMRPATPGQPICAKAECYNVTQTVAFVRATALDNDRNRPVATATGTFTVAKPK